MGKPGKTAAERQREYRERKKQNDPEYLQKERNRAKKYRKPAKSLSKKTLIERREKNKLYAQRYRDKQKNKKRGKYRSTNRQH